MYHASDLAHSISQKLYFFWLFLFHFLDFGASSFVTPVLPPEPNTTTSGFRKQGDSKPWGGEYGSASELGGGGEGGLLRKSAVLHSSHLHWRETDRLNHCSSRGQETESWPVLCVLCLSLRHAVDKIPRDCEKFRKKLVFYQPTHGPKIHHNKWQNCLPLLENLWRKWGS